MQVAFVIYNGMTALDFIGIYDPITRLKTMGFMPDLSWQVCAYTDTVIDNTGLCFTPQSIAQPLQNYDLIILPGGFSARDLMDDINFITWIKTSVTCPLKASVCTGSLLWGAAGFLRGKQATTHPTAYHYLENFATVIKDQRIVDAGDVITARGVTAAIDLGLYLCEKLAGYEVKQRIRIQMDYPESNDKQYKFIAMDLN
jgi:cyclohexyl-isocyanide hydratase